MSATDLTRYKDAHGSPAFGQSALGLADNGWRVFPCVWVDCKNAKRPLTEHGHLDATTDHEQISSWWSKWPRALIGAPVPDSLIVIDIDPRNGGSLEALTGPLPQTLTVWSGRNDGGRHLYFRRRPGTFTATPLPDGIDLKVNGYCIMPPSLHPATKQPYTWELHDFAPLPASLQELLRPAERPSYVSNGSRNRSGLVRKVAEAQNGNRHNALVWSCFRARDDGILDELANELVAAAVAAGGESEASARGVVASVRRTQA
jgi:hypothetical protein